MASASLIRRSSWRNVRPSARFAGESDPLLPHDEENNDDEDDDPDQQQLRAPNPFRDLPVYQNIWRIRRDIINSITDPYSLDQLRAPRLNTSVIRPLVESLYDLHDVSIIYCLLVNRYRFQREITNQADLQSVNLSRAQTCELIAVKLLRQFEDESSGGRKGLLLLAHILIAGFEPFQNAPGDLLQQHSRAAKFSLQDRGGYERQMTALEVAIISNSKSFLSTSSCQKVIDAIYTGRIIYTPTTFMDILPDHYKHQAITMYDPRKSPLMNQYRLCVPRIRNFLELTQFCVLLALFFLVMENREPERFNATESIFCIYTFGWMLDQAASILEHGLEVYTQNLWSFLDLLFCVIYLVYFGLRMHGLKTGEIDIAQPALDILAMGAPFLVPRLAFNIFSDNLLFVSLRDMMSKFMLLTILAVWSFAGFYLSMLWLSDGAHRPVTIGKWMIWVWFGLDGTGIQRSAEFHWLLGPILMIAFAILGNTLFLTILVSTLSNSFARIMRHSAAEVQYRKAVLTLEGVKSDAIFSYYPPFNMLALIVLLPLKMILSKRWFHKINVACIRTLNAPILLFIAYYERSYLWPRLNDVRRPGTPGGTRRPSLYNFTRFHVHGDIQAVFDVEPPSDTPVIPMRDEEAEEDDDDILSRRSSIAAPNNEDSKPETIAFAPDVASGPSAPVRKPRRKTSIWSAEGFEARVAGLLESHEDGGGDVERKLQSVQARVGDMSTRMHGLETALSRIERMLGELAERTVEIGQGDDGNVDNSQD